jgi:hypothetical protein
VLQWRWPDNQPEAFDCPRPFGSFWGNAKRNNKKEIGACLRAKYQDKALIKAKKQLQLP